MKPEVHIPLDELKAAICAMIDHYKIEMNTEVLTINQANDWYWSTGIAGALVDGPDQPQLTIGDAGFDWECIKSMMKNHDEPVAIMLMKVPPLLQLMVREITSSLPKDANAPAAG